MDSVSDGELESRKVVGKNHKLRNKFRSVQTVFFLPFSIVVTKIIKVILQVACDPTSRDIMEIHKNNSVYLSHKQFCTLKMSNTSWS